MRVLDTRLLTTAQKSQLSAAYDAVEKRDLASLPEMASDVVRQEIDKALESALGLPSLRPHREMLAREPVISLKSI